MDVLQRHGDVEEISKKLDECLSVDADEVETYRRLIQDGKDVGRQGDMKTALKFFRLAFDIRQSEKLESRIKRIEEHLAEEEDEEEEDDDFVNVNGSGLMLFKDLYDKLYGYQREGVAFLYGLHRDRRKGGILADDMGLGKTIQVISFLSGMYDAELAKHTLLVMPTSLITNWTKEFAKWTPGMRIKEFHGTVKERTRNLEKVQRRSGVVLTTYTMIMNNWQQLSSHRGGEFTWDYVILDEAHKIKTASTKTAKSVYAIPAKNRVLLTGTPVQNNLKEMWALFDFACQGTLLGTAKTFKTEYENPITRAREKDATPGEKALGSRMSENLVATIKPHFLRRTKAEVNKANVAQQEEDAPQDSGAVMPTLKRKNDLIVWTYLSAVQEDIYRQFISLDHIKELLMTTRSPLAELTIMKKLCDHPRLFPASAIAKLGLGDDLAEDQPGAAGSIADVPDDTLIAESGKLVFLFALLERLRDEGHRTLVFARYRKVLDIIQRILGNRGFKVMRLDGTVSQLAERERLITRFQTDPSYSVFLLTTQVGGVGITLTAADRVVIYDPSWNPATDAQAVDRAYRIGQTDNVVIYRLITCGTVEEKIYRRQVFKDSLIRQSTGDKKNPFRYFSKQELKELFILEDPRSSSTQLQLQALHSRHRRTDPELDEHIARLHAMEMFGITDHDLMFSLDVEQDEAPEDQEAQHYIEGRVQKAQELMKAESELQMQLAESTASGTEPAWLRQPESDNNNRERTRKKSNPRPSPSVPRHDFNGSPAAVVELDASGSDQEVQQAGGPVIDLTADDSAASEDQAVVLEGSRDELPSVKRERIVVEEIEDSLEAIEDSLEAIEDSLEASEAPGDGSPALVAAFAPPLNRRLSVLKPDASASSGLESFGGNFNLQLEESDLFSDREAAKTEEEEEEEEERKLLLQLQTEGSFDVYKSLNESRHKLGHASDPDRSGDGSVVATKKKRALVIYDSDEEEEEEEEEEEGQLNNSFQVLGASTPKSAPAPLRSRRSVGGRGNTSVASRRSFIVSMMEDIDAQPAEEDEEEEEEEEEEVSGKHSDEEEIIGSTCDELQLEETAGETLNTEEEGEESGHEGEESRSMEESGQEGEESSNMDETGQEGEESSNMDETGQEGEESSTPELASDEKMDQCTAAAGVKMKGIDPSEEEEESFLSLVRRGKERKSEGKLDEALSFFLRAIDLKPGDPEVQLMTIQLYRQQSR